MNTGFILAIVLAVLVYFLLMRTTVGYRLRAVGEGASAARYAGINVPFYMVLSMFLAGALAGLAGTVEVLGVHHRALEDISAGYGFSAIVAALFGRLHPIGIIPASVLFGALILGADMMQRAVSIPAANCACHSRLRDFVRCCKRCVYPPAGIAGKMEALVAQGQEGCLT